ncbi:hypothetical protein B5X24_HaOG215060 [Helicoverpa armigera]|nr:hypothetical protein B5X24_HaOG215060 [Helicoverpa armigera]
MFRIFILLYGLSLTQAYKVKVSGKFSLGNDLARAFNELCTQLVDKGIVPQEVVDNIMNKEKDQEDPEDKENQEQKAPPLWDRHEDGAQNYDDKTKKVKRKDKATQDDNAPVLDKMLHNNAEKMHLYGYHKQPSNKPEDFTGKPLNNVHV